ncbi:hypothetical protein DERP_004518 [Dermatophagoides pteronyssinus]|uniref:Uncharacterized protein n=1 Tax=Dermatophagoides pteronyssinus TaxID=6956 RepID=A0ABQ8JP05_DERPT|nr:hypothetical protein DERP_004518 [Dermatophagoides pteronyssinus]
MFQTLPTSSFTSTTASNQIQFQKYIKIVDHHYHYCPTILPKFIHPSFSSSTVGSVGNQKLCCPTKSNSLQKKLPKLHSSIIFII